MAPVTTDQSFSLYQCTKSGELETRLESHRPAAFIVEKLTAMVDSFGMAALKHYAVKVDGFDRTVWAADKWWESRVGARMVKVPWSAVMARLMVTQRTTDLSDVDRLGVLLTQNTVRQAVEILESLGFVVAEEVEGV